MNAIHFKKYFYLIIFLFFSDSEPKIYAKNITPSNWAEIGLAVAKGPLASLSYKYKNEHHTQARTIHLATDLVRFCCKILNIINHPHEISSPTNFWIGFDAYNIMLDLKHKEKDSLDDLDDTLNAADKETEHVSTMVNHIQRYILPGLEAGAATACAVATENTAIDRVRRRQARSIESLSRAVSVYLNHKKSKSALVLLLAALVESSYTLTKSIAASTNSNSPNGNGLNNGNNGDGENNDNENNNDFDWNFWGDEERERERNREIAERERQRQIQEQHRQELEQQAGFPPEFRRENGELFVYRNGQRTLDAGIIDPILLDEFEAGAEVRILACNHGLRLADIPMIQNQNQCPTCNQPRIPNREHVRIVPGEAGTIANIN